MKNDNTYLCFELLLEYEKEFRDKRNNLSLDDFFEMRDTYDDILLSLTTDINKSVIEDIRRILFQLHTSQYDYIFTRDIFEKKVKSEYVYMIICDECTKIGVSVRPNVRTKHLSTKIPFIVNDIKIYEVIDMYAIEKIIHKKFDGIRMEGEWFELGVEQINEISSFLHLCTNNKDLVKSLLDNGMKYDNIKEILLSNFGGKNESK